MNLSERIWKEFVKVKTKEAYSRIYLSEQRKYNSWFVMSVGFFSILGTLLFKFWNLGTLISSVIISALACLKFIGMKVLLKDDDVRKLEDIVDFYSLQSNKLERLWYIAYYENLSNEKILDNLYDALDKENSIDKIANSIVKEVDLKILTKAEKEVDFYCENTF